MLVNYLNSDGSEVDAVKVKHRSFLIKTVGQVFDYLLWLLSERIDLFGRDNDLVEQSTGLDHLFVSAVKQSYNLV